MGHNLIQPNLEDDIEVALREYHLDDEPLESVIPKEPITFGILTSIRDVGADDMNGILVKGMIESINHAINDRRLGLEHLVRLGGIITDDTVLDTTHPFPKTPQTGEQWIHPLTDRNYEGELLTSNTHHIPSTFRLIPKYKTDEIAESRLEFEEEIAKVSKQMGAEFILSDHFMVRILHLIESSRYGIGKVLNIHPGITDPKDPNRLPGPSPTQDAIDRVRGKNIEKRPYRKKRSLYIPRSKPKVRVFKTIQSHFSTGASLHVMNGKLDRGPVIADSQSTPVYSSDNPNDLRKRNYPTKAAVLIAGIEHFVLTMLRNIDQLNFEEEEGDSTARSVRINRRSLL